MTRPKARFLGESGPQIAASSPKTGELLAAFVAKHAGDSEDDFASLVDDIQCAAWLARQTVLMAADDSSAQDARAELSLVMRLIDDGETGQLANFWPRLSPDVWSAVRCHVVTDRFEQGDFTDVASLRNAISTALDRYFTAKRRPHEVQHAAALQLACRVEAALLAHAPNLHISLAAYADNAGQSPIVELLHEVGQSIGICLEMTGWRDILSEARRGR